MRLTTSLWKQHIDRMFKNKWELQSKRKILDKGLKAQLESMGKTVHDARQIVGMAPEPEPQIVLPEVDDGKIDQSSVERRPRLDQSHPDWHDQPCVNYNEHTSFLAGLEQGLNLTKTQIVERSLPQKIKQFHTESSSALHERVQKAIIDAKLLDATQEKLPKLIDVKRPGWNYPREYGIPKWRQNMLLMDNLFRVCESQLVAEKAEPSRLHIATEVKVKVVFENEDAPLIFSLKPHYLFLSKTRLEPHGQNVAPKQLPSIYPLSPTVNLVQANIYRVEDHFPARKTSPYPFVSMAVFCHNQPRIKNSEAGLYGRLLAHSFAVAASQARSIYGSDVQDLPEPITLNSVQTDGKDFYFGALQLNSLNIGEAGDMAKNLVWLQEKMPLYQSCRNEDKRPVLEGYNPDVIDTLLSVYRSQLASK